MNTGSRETYTKDVELDVVIYSWEDIDIFATIKGEIEVEYYEIHDVIGTQIGDKDEYYTELSEDDIEDDIITIAKLTNDNRTSRQILKQIIKKLVNEIIDSDLTGDININYEIDLIAFIKTEKLWNPTK